MNIAELLDTPQQAMFKDENLLPLTPAASMSRFSTTYSSSAELAWDTGEIRDNILLWLAVEWEDDDRHRGDKEASQALLAVACTSSKGLLSAAQQLYREDSVQVWKVDSNPKPGQSYLRAVEWDFMDHLLELEMMGCSKDRIVLYSSCVKSTSISYNGTLDDLPVAHLTTRYPLLDSITFNFFSGRGAVSLSRDHTLTGSPWTILSVLHYGGPIDMGLYLDYAGSSGSTSPHIDVERDGEPAAGNGLALTLDFDREDPYGDDKIMDVLPTTTSVETGNKRSRSRSTIIDPQLYELSINQSPENLQKSYLLVRSALDSSRCQFLQSLTLNAQTTGLPSIFGLDYEEAVIIAKECPRLKFFHFEAGIIGPLDNLLELSISLGKSIRDFRIDDESYAWGLSMVPSVDNLTRNCPNLSTFAMYATSFNHPYFPTGPGNGNGTLLNSGLSTLSTEVITLDSHHLGITPCPLITIPRYPNLTEYTIRIPPETAHRSSKLGVAHLLAVCFDDEKCEWTLTVEHLDKEEDQEDQEGGDDNDDEEGVGNDARRRNGGRRSNATRIRSSSLDSGSAIGIGPSNINAHPSSPTSSQNHHSSQSELDVKVSKPEPTYAMVRSGHEAWLDVVMELRSEIKEEYKVMMAAAAAAATATGVGDAGSRVRREGGVGWEWLGKVV